ncbi:MAG: methionine--tRNA ligase subunit beta [Planctomycetota bacterium]|jgi:methionyl-tRNA synthetase|nr:methionine--tRNA ligase subunit beta [Planctomycetota bacterium]
MDATTTVPEGLCTFADFEKIKLRVAEVVAAAPHPNADKLLVLQLRLGERTKQICAGIRAYYSPEQLVGKRIVIVDNLEPRKLRGEVSEGMLLASHDRGGADGAERVTLITTDAPDCHSGSAVG